ncbi:MAG: hypothetical protein ACO1NM_04830 [Sphingobium phenoxybenzoativorans]
MMSPGLAVATFCGILAILGIVYSHFASLRFDRKFTAAKPIGEANTPFSTTAEPVSPMAVQYRHAEVIEKEASTMSAEHFSLGDLLVVATPELRQALAEQWVATIHPGVKQKQAAKPKGSVR